MYNRNMRINEVLDEIKHKYPGKNIILNDKHNLTEILCEVDPTSAHRDYSIAVSVIDEITPHYHDASVEVYEVIKGELKLYVNGAEYYLKEKESFTIQPGEKHWAKGDETWVKVTSKPGWSQGDHHKT